MEQKKKMQAMTEKQRETAGDVLFSYDLENRTVDVVNSPFMDGHWDCGTIKNMLLDERAVHEDDREKVRGLQQPSGETDVEFRIRREGETDYRWVAVRGRVISDAEGRSIRLIGRFCEIQEQKEEEERRLRQSLLDGATGFYSYGAGMEKLEEARENRPEGTLVYLSLDNLAEMAEQNGVTFGDLVLEEFSELLRRNAEPESICIRMREDAVCVWMPESTRQEGTELVMNLQVQLLVRFQPKGLNLVFHAGIASAGKETETREVILRANSAQLRAFEASDGKLFDFWREEKESALPDLPWPGREVVSAAYGPDINMVSMALALFDRGDNLSAQMYLLFRKIGQYYGAEDVLYVVIRPDSHTVYTEHQWHKNIVDEDSERTESYDETDREIFFGMLKEQRMLGWDRSHPIPPEAAVFCRAEGTENGYAVPLYDNGVYMGVLSVRNISAGGRLAEEGWNRLAELGNAVQSKINQQRHDMNSRAKAEFLSRMSHEIRTPMNSIIGMTAIALQENQSRERMLDCLRKIKNSSDFLLGLINDFLDMSKLESGEVQLEAVDFSMKELLDTTVELFTPQVEEKSLELIQDISLKHEWFEGDRLRITQILANLMDNAVKFTGGHGKVVLAVREEPLDPETAKLFFSVRDTGMGIGKQEQARISRYFEQEDEDVITFSKGTGLGLTICSRLAKLMGSRLELESEPGVGSVFGFALILPFGSQERNREEKISFDGFRVLVVEDNELNAEIAQSILEDYHFAVDCVYDGAQALERIRESEPGTYDLVLMDILMPVMDGLDATRAIRALDREDCKTLPIVAMSANVFDDDLKKAEECGMNGHLSKPVEIDKLYQMLKKILSGKKKVD